MNIVVSEFRPREQNTLQGFVTARLTDVGLEVRDLALHEKQGKRWFQLPAKLRLRRGKPAGGPVSPTAGYCRARKSVPAQAQAIESRPSGRANCVGKSPHLELHPLQNQCAPCFSRCSVASFP